MKFCVCLYILSLTATLFSSIKPQYSYFENYYYWLLCLPKVSGLHPKKVLAGEDMKSHLGMPGSACTSLSQQISWKEMVSCCSGRDCIILPWEQESDFESFIRFLLDRDTHFQ